MNPILDVKDCTVRIKPTKDYFVTGGELDNAFFSLKVKRPTKDDFVRRIVINYPLLPEMEMDIDVCNPLWSLSIAPNYN